jgi:hypothetical protein
MGNLRELVEAYVKRVRELAEHVRGNEQATKQSLIGPFFTMLGFDLTDPRECVPEYKVDFGRDRSVKPIDWAFKHSGNHAFVVEAKEVGKKLAGYDEQLADYFAKDPNVKLGILTNGVQWRFFTDVVNPNVMDKEPFAKWDLLADDQPPFDVITLIQKSQFNPELIRTYAQRKRAQNLLLSELNRLLEPSSELTKLAISNIETRNLTQNVVDSWKPIVANAVQEWARQRTLTAVLADPNQNRATGTGIGDPGKIETTPEELEAVEHIRASLGPEYPLHYEDAVAYMKVHIQDRRTWVFARLHMDRKQPQVSVPLTVEQLAPHAGERRLATSAGWTSIPLRNAAELRELAPVLRSAYDAVKDARAVRSAD